ncbi:MAG: hypothetical protein AB7G47_09710 [Mycolicibacterium sp.]|uniref:hypothetical protein n=1 Tax=Mycolicibacterium sp. TaxID=2320850 RepID=UPI003D1205E3
MSTHPIEIEAEIRERLDALAANSDPAAFQALLGLSRYLGECLGLSARAMAEASSWGDVAGVAGTTKQAAWSRWHHYPPRRPSG